MTPKHKDPSYKNRVAVAPYNFVPLPEAILTVDAPPDQDRYDPDLLTGKLTCTLTTASPLFIRAARTLKEYEHKDEQGNPAPITPTSHFYGETEETLLIPGSSLRGMLRNMVEVVAHARLSGITGQPLFFRTVDVSSIGKAYGKRMTKGDAGKEGWSPVAQAGYMVIKEGDYCIRPAKEFFGVQHFRVDEKLCLKIIPNMQTMAIQKENNKWTPNRDYRFRRYAIWFRPTAPVSHLPDSPTFHAEVTELSAQDDRPNGLGWEKGYLITSGWVPSPKGGHGKHRHWIIGPAVDDEDQLIRVSDDDIDLYRERTGGLTQKVVNERISVLPQKPNEAVPCFYTFWEDETGQRRVAFGHTGMFRLPYQKSPKHMLPDNLKNATGYDLAEAMFGYVSPGGDIRGSVAGRVFITDARMQGNARDALMEMITISDQALSSPKPTTVQHYLTQSDPDRPDNLKHYDDDPNNDTVLRGSKFYWHVGQTAEVRNRLAQTPPIRPTDKLNKFKPVKENQQFVFETHFENLHPEELGALLWVLDKANDSRYRLKLGMAKPLGFGSIAIKYSVSLFDRAQRYQKLLQDQQWNHGALEEAEVQKKLEVARSQFESFVTKDSRVNPDGLGTIDELPRIRELLGLLLWEGHPANQLIRYMELDEFTGRKHIFPNLSGRPSRRPVLPNASKVIDPNYIGRLPDEPTQSRPAAGGSGKWHDDHGPKSKEAKPWDQQPYETIQPSRFSQPVKAKKIPPPVARMPAPKKELLTPVEKAPGQLKPGDVIWTTVSDAPGRGDISLIPDQAGPEDIATISSNNRGVKRYSENQRLLLRVISVEGDDKNGWVVDGEPIED
jgi:CRISPR-associated protein (TIGR03986 family)